MDRKRERRKRPTRVGWPGRLLARLPKNCRLLYPLYLAAQLDTEAETYASPRWPQAFDGLRVCFLSDIHYGALFGEERVRALTERVNALRPDVIVLGGDYGEDPEGAVEFFGLRPEFKARLGAVACLGNHDRIDAEELMPRLLQGMADCGVRPVINDAWVLERDGQKVAFASVDEFYHGAYDFEKTAAACRGADFTVFFPHTPDILPVVYSLPGGPFYQLALCGHTHGGQVAVLGRALHSSSFYGNRYRSGWFHEHGTDILVSNGVGTSLLPVRLGTRAQIHLLTMRTK